MSAHGYGVCAVRESLVRRRRVAAILVAAVLVKLVLLLLFEHRLYDDVIRAVNFGRVHLADSGVYAINSKTKVGPMIWYLLYRHVGVLGLKVVNLLLFVALFALQRRFGRGTFSEDAIAVALVLFAFYPGTNLTVVAGEQDDLVTLLLFALGAHVYVRYGAAFAAGLLMGLALLFKFSAGIFFAGFALAVAVVGGPRSAATAALGMALPFLILNLGDGFDSTRNLLYAAEVQLGYSTWSSIAFKLVSTGLLPIVLLSWWAQRTRGGRPMLLCCLIPSAYLAYVLLSRDAFSAGFVMMQGMWFAGFPLARFLLEDPVLARFGRRRVVVAGALAAYVVLATAITWHNLSHDTIDVRDRSAREVLAD